MKENKNKFHSQLFIKTKLINYPSVTPLAIMEQVINDDFQFVQNISLLNQNLHQSQVHQIQDVKAHNNHSPNHIPEELQLGRQKNLAQQKQKSEHGIQQQDYEDQFEVQEVFEVQVKEPVLNNISQMSGNQHSFIQQKQFNELQQLASPLKQQLTPPNKQHTPIHDDELISDKSTNREQKQTPNQTILLQNQQIKDHDHQTQNSHIPELSQQVASIDPSNKLNQHKSSQKPSPYDDQEQLRQQILSMQQQVENMLQMINQKSLLKQQSQQQLPPVQSPQLTLLQSVVDNNQKTQKIYRSQLNSLIKKQSELQIKICDYLSKSPSIGSAESTLSSNNNSSQSQGDQSQPKQLVQLIEQQILRVKESILETEKSNFNEKKSIKLLQNVLEKQSSTHSIPNSITKHNHSKNPLIQLGQSINIKKKLQQKLTEKLSKLQFQYNASFIKSEQANDHLNSLLDQFPQIDSNMNDQSLRITSRRTTLDRWSAKSNESILNKNLYEMLKKRKQKALKTKQLLKKQFEHQEKQLQRDIKGLKALIHQKELHTSQVITKNQSLQQKINSQIQANEHKKTKQKNFLQKQNQLRQRENQSQIIIHQKQQVQQPKTFRKQTHSQNVPIKVTLNVKEISHIKQPLPFDKKKSLTNMLAQSQNDIKNTHAQMSLICVHSQKPNQNYRKDMDQLKLLTQKKRLEIQENQDNQINSPSIPIKVQEEANNFRITKPKFPKFSTKRSLNQSKSSFNQSEDEGNQSPSPKDQYIQSFSSPKLLKPSFGAVKSLNNSIVMKQSFIRERSLSIEPNVQKQRDRDQGQQNKIRQQKKQQKREMSPFRPRSPLKKSPNRELPTFSFQSNLNTPINQAPRKQSQGKLPHASKQQQMMNVLRQSIIRVTSSSKKNKSVPKEVDNEKTLRNLLNQNLSMIRNESFTEPDVRKMKKYDMLEPRYNKLERKGVKEDQVQEDMNAVLDSVKTPKTKKRPYLSNSVQKSTRYIKLENKGQGGVRELPPTPKQVKKNQQQSLIECQMEQVKNQIQSTILKIKSIEQKIERQSSLNNKHRRTGHYRTGLSIKQREISFDEVSDSVQIDEG